MRFYDAVLPFIGGLACHLTQKYGWRGPESRVLYKPPEHGEMKEPREESAVRPSLCQRTLVSQHKERLARRTCVFTLGRDVRKKKGTHSDPPLLRLINFLL